MFNHFITNNTNLDKLQRNKNMPHFNRTKKKSKQKNLLI